MQEILKVENKLRQRMITVNKFIQLRTIHWLKLFVKLKVTTV